ncbi:response regulator [Maribacter sp. ACAM166]|uniref:hybrid sensor histidine kinase/response regulator n=1 Tax=Maribacter sp. ACAM166 TaxID=2508996 RepID=UPI0010FEDD12|nr:response regulator [Maribacter sp. ACAM166]TLP80122.1 response regulator [Maribacter sp. ACAM166]
MSHTILIIDDIPENLKVLSRILKPEGYKVRIANNGEQALLSIKNNAPDIILLDIMMPNMNGFEVCERLKSDEKTADIPVIFISALSETAEKVKAFEMGGVDYIEKPFIAKEAIARIRTHLTLKKQQQDLKKALQHLKQMQVQLVQSEKMSSLGVLTAGIAHEINNPVNFINGGVIALEMSFNDLRMIMQKYDSINSTDTGTLNGVLKEIELLKSKYEYDDIKELIPQLIDDIKLGATRTSEIVKGLGVFSRIDVGEMVESDIHAGLESTLKILQVKYKNGIEIKKEYDPTLPVIKCHPGKINQVFLNIINNAIAAVDGNGTITINTKTFKNKIDISIKDNGNGIPEEIFQKVFDPFFTTKDVGSGLGLSICHSIIESHNGKISIASTMGEGTEFTISIPKIK